MVNHVLKRRQLKKTNYKRRLELLQSPEPRLVVRRSNAHVHLQIVAYQPTGDKTLLEFMSGSLKKFGWHGNCANTSAAYLSGLALGVEAKKKGIARAHLDIGLQISSKQSILYAAALGAKQGGLDVPVGKKIAPSPARLRGEHVASYAQHLKKTDEKKYHVLFSAYLKSPIKPEELPLHVDEIKQRILASHTMEEGS